VHQWGTQLQCSLMGVSSVVSWDTMLITVLNARCRLPREVVFRKVDSHRLKHALEIQALQAIKHNKTMCAARWTTWPWSRLRMLPELCCHSTVWFGSYTFIYNWSVHSKA
jgi:hypothetical protein